MPFPLFLAFRYLKPDRSLYAIIRMLSLLGIALGVMILIVTMAIMTGFGEMWREKLMEFHSHVSVQGHQLSEWDETVQKKIKDTPGVTAISPAIYTRVMIKRDGFTAAPAIKGIDPFLEGDTSTIGDKIRPGSLLGEAGLADLAEEEVLLGSILAKNLGVVPGDTLNVYSPAGFGDADVVRLPEEVTVVGTFHIGMQMFDQDFMVGTLDTARELANKDEGISEFVVQLEDPMNAISVAKELQETLGPNYQVDNWIYDNATTFAALETEKAVMFFLLLIIAIVGGFCMICSLLIITMQKTRDIGLLKSMGFKTRHIVGVFTTMGFILGTIGVLLGLVGGLLIIKFRKPIMDVISWIRGTEVFPQEIYQFDTLPAKIVPADLWMIVICGMLICVLAGGIASLPAAFLKPVNALRHD